MLCNETRAKQTTHYSRQRQNLAFLEFNCFIIPPPPNEKKIKIPQTLSSNQKIKEKNVKFKLAIGDLNDYE